MSAAVPKTSEEPRGARDPIVSVRDASFTYGKREHAAVEHVHLSVFSSEKVAIVGESGSGKSTLARALVGLMAPSAGEVLVCGRPWSAVKRTDPERRAVQMVFQDPAESLNPRHTIGQILEEPFIIQRMGTRVERSEWAVELLKRVGLPADAAQRYPFEFSGGQRQRIGIARALALKPKLIVCDEPVSALDVSVQAQVLNLLLELQRDFGLAYLFIAHDLSVVQHMSDRVAVMYLGKIVEIAPAAELYRNPRHAYTKALLDAIPIADPTKRRERQLLRGDVPSPINPPAGCAFGHRMRHPKWEGSVNTDLTLKEIAPGHFVQPCPCCTD